MTPSAPHVLWPWLKMVMTTCTPLLLMTTMMTASGQVTSPSTSPDLSPPTVVVMIDDAIEEENRQIASIFTNINKINDPSMSNVRFDVVIVTNDSMALQQACEKLREGMVALVDMTSRRVAPLLRSLASNAGITYVSMVDDSYYRKTDSADEATQWRVEPVAVQMLRVVADIVISENLNNVALIYDDTFDIQNTPRRILTNVPAQHLYVKINDSEEETQRQVDMLKDISIKSIFIIANNDNAEMFLGMLNKNKGDAMFPDLFVLTKDQKLTCSSCTKSMRVVAMMGKTSGGTRDEFIHYMESVIGIHHFSIDDIHIDEALIYDVARLICSTMPSEMSPITYSNCSDVGFEPENQTLVHRLQSMGLADALKNYSLEGVLGPLETVEGEAVYEVTLLISEMIWQDGYLTNRVQLGEWSHRTGLNISTSSLTTANKKRHYRVVTVPGIPPFVYKTDAANGTGTPEYYGYCIELLDELAKRLDFDYEIYDSPDGQFGSLNDDGSWSGVINELIQKKADIAVGPISVMAERENVVDFTVPYYDLVGLTILMSKPEFDYSLVKFLTVLDEGVWGCIIGAFFVFSVLICIFDRLSPFSYQNNRKEWSGDGQEPRIFTFKEGIWFCMMSLTPQGGGETPRALSGRLVAATWWLFGFIIIATYTANLAAFLTVRRLETKIDSLDDLSKQFKIKYAPMNGSNAQIYFQRMANIEERFYDIWKNMSLSNDMEAVERAQLAVWDYPVSDKYSKLWQTMKTTSFPNSKGEAVAQVLTGHFAFIADATVNKYMMYTNCDLWEVGEEFSRKPYALAVQEGSELRSELSNQILQLINQRKLEEMKTTWWDKDRLTCPDIENESDGISIRNIGGVFFVIVIGSALALIMLAMECYWYKYKPKQKKKLYSLTSRTNLTENGQGLSSSSSLASSKYADPRFNGDLTGTGRGHGHGHTANGLQESFINDGFQMSVMG